MFEEDSSELDAPQTLSRLAELRVLSERADRSILVVAAHWADLHGVIKETDVSLPGMERLVEVGGEGTPEVAEFAAAELGAELAISSFAASMLIGDALDLRHRLPLTWRRVLAGEVKPWVARRVAQSTRRIPATTVGFVDGVVARWADRLTWTRLAALVDAAIIQADPAAAQAVVEVERTDHGVWVGRSTERGTKTVFIRADAPDVIWFDATIDRIADGIALLGDTSSKKIRRGRAVGVIANPQQALNLFDQAAAAFRTLDPADVPAQVTHIDDANVAEDADSADDAAIGQRSARRIAGTAKIDPRPPATLYVHLAGAAFDGAALDCADSGVARVEGVGPVTVEQARRWLGHCAVTVKPVIDLPAVAPVDGYEIPDRLGEAVRLVWPADVCPYASSTSRTLDIDHTSPYVSRPDSSTPGQTRIGNLGPMTRLHHRLKTHGRWQLAQPYSGIFIWRSPHGAMYLVDHTGTRKLPDAA